MVSTPAGKVVILTVTNEKTFRQVKDELFKSENINPSSQHLIWNGEALHPDDDLSKVLLETTTGLAVLHLMGGTQIFVYDLNRKITLNVEADDTIRDVINHVIAMLGGSNYVLEHNRETLIEEKTVAYYQIKPYHMLYCTEVACLKKRKQHWMRICNVVCVICDCV